MTRKRKIDQAKAKDFLKSSVDSDDESELSRVFDWMDPVAVKKTAIALEDRASKRKRLKEEGPCLLVIIWTHYISHIATILS